MLAWVAAVVLAICLGRECQACARLARQNRAWQDQLSPQEQVLQDSQRLSNLLAQLLPVTAPSNRPVTAVPTEEPSAPEIARLRAELQTLRRQNLALQPAGLGSTANAAAQRSARAGLANGPSTSGDAGTQLEILQANYWTANTNLDVSAELRERIRNDQLNAIASNNLKADPEFGQVKHLTVIYRYGGVLRTNEFREGEYISLPGD